MRVALLFLLVLNLMTKHDIRKNIGSRPQEKQSFTYDR